MYCDTRNLLFSICLGHQRPSYSLFLVILLISSGIALASYGSTQFVVHGFVLVLAASVIGTLRWVLTQSLLKDMDKSANRILAVVYYISPASALGLLPIALFSEGQEMLTSKFVREPHLLVASMGFIFVSGCLAFVLIFVEILLVKKTSALSLGIAGSLKDVTQVVLAVFIFGDHLVPLNVLGLVVATSGMLFYTFLKHAAVDMDQEHGEAKYTRVATSDAFDGGGDGLEKEFGDRDDGDEDGDGAEGQRYTHNDNVLVAAGEKYRMHEIQVIDMDERNNPKLASSSSSSSSSKREDKLVRRESKEYHQANSNDMHV